MSSKNDKRFRVGCDLCFSQDPHQCSRYTCDYGVKKPHRRHLGWREHYAAMKRDQGEATAQREYKALDQVLGPKRKMVCLDATSEGKRKAIEDQFPGHFMSHVPACPTPRPMTREMKEKIKAEEEERIRLEHLQAEKRTPIKKSKGIHWSHHHKLPHEEMYSDKRHEFASTGQVYWALDDQAAQEAANLRMPEDAGAKLCKEKPLDAKVSCWPADILEPRKLCVWSNCHSPHQAQAPAVTNPCSNNSHCATDSLLGSAECVVTSVLPDRRMAKRRKSEMQVQTRAPWDPNYAPYYPSL